jgi:hypothetical protein
MKQINVLNKDRRKLNSGISGEDEVKSWSRTCSTDGGHWLLVLCLVLSLQHLERTVHMFFQNTV